ncbi:hypothetical protein FRC06_011125 [Ceratobasidium sp. 370]|nr:hypothetical protein FRC06_011125 [Ceratobasidium sp. 370]
MIQSSPALTTLKLHWPPFFNCGLALLDVNRVFGTLDVAIPCLRHFEFWARYSEVHSAGIFDTTRSSNHINSFFENHPHIETLAIEWPRSYLPTIDPQLVQGMFPALRHLTGPDPLCAVVVGSDLKLQLESLTILELRNEIDMFYCDAIRVATKLPRLRHLGFPLDHNSEAKDYPIRSNDHRSLERSLERCLSAAPELISLEIYQFSMLIDLDRDIRAAFKHPNLRKIAMPFPEQFTSPAVDCHEIIRLATQLAGACPRLKYITNNRPSFYEEYELQRSDNGDLEWIYANTDDERFIIPVLEPGPTCY